MTRKSVLKTESAYEGKVQEITKWLESNHNITSEQYKPKQKELKSVVNPIMQKIYAAAGGASGRMLVDFLRLLPWWRISRSCSTWGLISWSTNVEEVD